MADKPAKKVMVQVRLSEALVKEVDHISVEWGLFRNETMEKLLGEIITVKKQQQSLWPSFSP